MRPTRFERRKLASNSEPIGSANLIDLGRVSTVFEGDILHLTQYVTKPLTLSSVTVSQAVTQGPGPVIARVLGCSPALTGLRVDTAAANRSTPTPTQAPPGGFIPPPTSLRFPVTNTFPT